MTNLKDIERSDRRLRILQALAKAPDYATNEAVLRGELKCFGHGVSHDVLRADLAWLAELELLNIETIGTDIQVATITLRGVDVASGLATVPGVKRPRPGA